MNLFSFSIIGLTLLLSLFYLYEKNKIMIRFKKEKLIPRIKEILSKQFHINDNFIPEIEIDKFTKVNFKGDYLNQTYLIQLFFENRKNATIPIKEIKGFIADILFFSKKTNKEIKGVIVLNNQSILDENTYLFLEMFKQTIEIKIIKEDKM